MNPLSIALGGKGSWNLLRRTGRILNRYGLTPEQMARELQTLVALTRQFQITPTFPVTAVVLQRHRRLIADLQEAGSEFAIHGYTHVDHSTLSAASQQARLAQAMRLFMQARVQPRGFRGPYLRWNDGTFAALRDLGLSYDASQALDWGVPARSETSSYRRAVKFYRALPAQTHLSLPSLSGDLVCIPYSLPDDEALVERLGLSTSAEMTALWLAILRRTHALGELFTLGLHPERTRILLASLEVILSEARTLVPQVWIASLGEIAEWWRERAKASLSVTVEGSGRYRVRVAGPRALTVLVRGASVSARTCVWGLGYSSVPADSFIVECSPRPVLGASEKTPPPLVDFFRQLGYLVESPAAPGGCAIHLDALQLSNLEQPRTWLEQVEKTDAPLIRLSHWPHGARSALAITGDIDAITVWDYGLRFLGG